MRSYTVSQKLNSSSTPVSRFQRDTNFRFRCSDFVAQLAHAENAGVLVHKMLSPGGSELLLHLEGIEDASQELRQRELFSRFANALSKSFPCTSLFVCFRSDPEISSFPLKLFHTGERWFNRGSKLCEEIRLCERIDDMAIDDGYSVTDQLFVMTREGSWSLVHFACNAKSDTFRRYHWQGNAAFDCLPWEHQGIVGKPGPHCLNFFHTQAKRSRESLMELLWLDPNELFYRIHQLRLRGSLQKSDSLVEKRLATLLGIVHDKQVKDFYSLLKLDSVGKTSLHYLAQIIVAQDPAALRFEDVASPRGYFESEAKEVAEFLLESFKSCGDEKPVKQEGYEQFFTQYIAALQDGLPLQPLRNKAKKKSRTKVKAPQKQIEAVVIPEEPEIHTGPIFNRRVLEISHLAPRVAKQIAFV